MSRPLLSTNHKVDQRGVVLLVAVIFLPFLCTYLTSEQTGGYIGQAIRVHFNDYTQYFEYLINL